MVGLFRKRLDRDFILGNLDYDIGFCYRDILSGCILNLRIDLKNRSTVDGRTAAFTCEVLVYRKNPFAVNLIERYIGILVGLAARVKIFAFYKIDYVLDRLYPYLAQSCSCLRSIGLEIAA